MKKLKGHITISRQTGLNGDSINIAIEDKNSHARFVELKVSLEDFAMCITGQAHMYGEMTVRGLDVVGKIKEQKRLSFEISDGFSSRSNRDKLNELAIEAAEDGWTPSLYFRSQGSFHKDQATGKSYANTTQYRYVEVEDE